jgi:hypothetical protein
MRRPGAPSAGDIIACREDRSTSSCRVAGAAPFGRADRLIVSSAKIRLALSVYWASFQNIVETSDPEPTVSVGIEQQTVLAGLIGIAVLPGE